MLRQAYAANEANDLALSTSLLDQVKALNPNQHLLWRQYASVAYKLGRHEKVIDDLKHEVQINGRDTTLYPLLADNQAFYGHMEDVPETMREWMKVDSENSAPVARLVATLNGLDRSAEAVVAAEQAFPRFSEGSKKNAVFLLDYGVAELKSGKLSAGTATLAAVINDNADRAVQNTAAYELANYKQALPLAEATEHNLLAQLATETATWTGDEASRAVAATSSTIYSSWDTMGWILYRQGKWKEAETYLAAAFLSRPTAEIGGHLGDARAALGDLTGARNAYLLATPATPYSNGRVETPAAKARRLEIEAKIEAMKKGGARVEDVGNMTNLRTIQLGDAAGRTGSAEYRVLMSAKGVERVEPAASKTVAGGADLIRTMQTARFFPAGSPIRLIKLGILDCHAETCELIVEP